MSNRFQDKVIIVTGGASGMGLSTVQRFLDEGANVVVGDLNEENGEAVLAQAKDDGYESQIRFVKVDVSKESNIEELLQTASSQFGRLDVLFNNAGIGGAFGPITEIDEEDWDQTHSVMLKGVFLGIKHAARILIEQGEGGSIINTASVAGLSGGAGPAAYSAIKAGVINLTRASAVELAKHKIRVNCICPGGILTPLVHRGNPDMMKDRLTKLQPWPEVGEGKHIAGAVVFLASDDSEFVTGHPLIVDGGLTAAGPSAGRSNMGGGMFAGYKGLDTGTTGVTPKIVPMEKKDK